MFMKVLNAFSQATIIVLALVLIITITTKQSSNAALEDFQRQVNETLQTDRNKSDLKLRTLEDNLNRYQQLRETRAQIFGKRLDELYDLYKKDPSPIVRMNQTETVESVSSQNLVYLEAKSNKVDEKVDLLDSKLTARVGILEKKMELIQADKKSNSKIIQNNIQTQNNSNR